MRPLLWFDVLLVQLMLACQGRAMIKVGPLPAEAAWWEDTMG